MNSPVLNSQLDGSEAEGLWRLWDMINFMLPHYLACLRLVSQEIAQAQFRVERDGEDALVLDTGKERIRQNLEYVVKKAEEFGLETVINRVGRIYDKFRLQPSVLCLEIANEMNVLLEAFEDDTKFLYLYAYPKLKVARFIRFRSEWAPALSAFKSIEKDVEEASDLYGLGRDTACVFHCMRVLEKGLRALANAVGVNYDSQQWYNVLNEIEAAIRKKQGLPKSIAKLDDLRFYSEAAKEFFYFKDGWRNYVSHGGDAYDEHQALGTMEHVRAFMNHLASRLSEVPNDLAAERAIRLEPLLDETPHPPISWDDVPEAHEFVPPHRYLQRLYLFFAVWAGGKALGRRKKRSP